VSAGTPLAIAGLPPAGAVYHFLTSAGGSLGFAGADIKPHAVHGTGKPQLTHALPASVALKYLQRLDLYAGPMVTIPSMSRKQVKDFFNLLSSRTRVTSSNLHMIQSSKERPEKILVAMFRLSKGSTRPLKYEDIVVKAFEMFPDEFALRGYPQYPDSSDIHKPLYGPLKRQGLIRSANKTFALTARGVEIAKRLVDYAGKSLEQAVSSGDRMTRDQKTEVDRMLAAAAFRLYTDGQKERILDTDFYAFMGCTVRTPRNEFLGRLASTDAAIIAAKKLAHPTTEAAGELKAVWEYIQEKFRGLVERRQGGKDGDSGKSQNRPPEERV
jgi:hypothetical protein